MLSRREVHTTGLYIPNTTNPAPSSSHTYESLPSSLPIQYNANEAAPSSLPTCDRTYDSIPSSLTPKNDSLSKNEEAPEYAYIESRFEDKDVVAPLPGRKRPGYEANNNDDRGGMEIDIDCDIEDNPAYQ